MPALFRPPWAPNPAERLASRPAEQLRRNPERKLTGRARGYGRDWEGLRAVILAEEPMCWEWPDTESSALPTQSTMLFQSARYPSAGLMPPTCSPCAGRATTTKSIPAMAISVTVTANQIKKPNDWFSTFSEPVEVTSMPRRTSKAPPVEGPGRMPASGCRWGHVALSVYHEPGHTPDFEACGSDGL